MKKKDEVMNTPQEMVSEEVSPGNFSALIDLFGQNIRTDPVKALEYIQKAYKIARVLNTLPELSQAWYSMGVINLIFGQSSKAVPFLKKAVKAMDELGETVKRTRARGNLANALNDLGELDKAEKQYRKLIKEFGQLDDQTSVAKTLYNLGNILMKRSLFGEALQSYQAALEIYRSESVPLSEAETLCMMGGAYARLFDYEKNLQCCQRALELVEKEENPYFAGTVYNALGNAYLFIKQYDKAIEYYQKGLDIGRQYGMDHQIASNLTNIAETLTVSKRYQEALSYAEEALKHDKKTDVLHYLAIDLFTIGRIHYLTRNLDTSVRYVNKALKLAGEAGLKEIWIGAAILQLHNYAHQKAFGKGKKLFAQLEETLQGSQLNETYLHFLEAGAILFSAMGDFPKSNELFNKYHELTKEHITQESQRRAQYLQLTWETERRENEKRWLAKQNKLLEKRIQQELEIIREKDRQLAEQENMALLGKITAGIAHELNNPLTAIKQAVEITLATIAKEKSGELYLSAKQKDIYRMLQRINRLVEIIKVIAHSPDRFTTRPFRVNDMVAEFTDLFSDRMLNGDIALATELKPNLPEVEGDAIRFIQVISILVHNSCDALSASKVKLRKVIIRTYVKDGKVILEVSDNGVGMSPEQLAKAKQPFYSTKDVDKGMGMGLSIASSIVSNMQGELNIQSSPGKGTTVSVAIPVPTS